MGVVAIADGEGEKTVQIATNKTWFDIAKWASGELKSLTEKGISDDPAKLSGELKGLQGKDVPAAFKEPLKALSKAARGSREFLIVSDGA